MQDENKKNNGISRRAFVAALASLPFINVASSESAEAASMMKPFSFVYLCDTHLCNGKPDNAYKMLQESQLFLQESIKGINALKPDFVVFGGDQVENIGKNEANWNFFLDVAQSLKCPWYFVLGEDDVVADRIPVDKSKQFGPDFKGRGIAGSDTWWSVDPLDGVHLIGLDTSIANSTGGDISSQQIDWLKNDLAANRGKFTIIVTHHPLLPPAPYDGGPPFDEYILPDGADVREILTSDVKLVLSGHLYINKAQLERYSYHVSCAGLNIYPCQYKYFRVGKDSILMESMEVPLPKLVKKAEESLVASALASKINQRKPNEVAELFRGQDEDQNAIMSLGANKSIQALSKKQIKEDQERRDAELEKQAEQARTGKVKEKEKDKDKGKDDEKNKKSDEKEGKKGKDKKGDEPDAKEKKGDKKEKSEPKESGKSKKSDSKDSSKKGKGEKDESDKAKNAAGKSDKSTSPKADTIDGASGGDSATNDAKTKPETPGSTESKELSTPPAGDKPASGENSKDK